MKICVGQLVFLIFLGALVGVAFTSAIMLRHGSAEMTYFPDFWNARCY